MKNVPKGKLLLDTTREWDNKRNLPKCIDCGFTLVLCFSRRWCVKPFFERFVQMPIDVDRCHLIIFDNSDRTLLKNELLPWAKKLAKVFYTVRYYKSYRPVGGTFRWEPDQGINKSKIPKIYKMHLDLLDLIHTKKFVMLEDDTIPPKEAVDKLLWLLDHNKDAAVVSGIATGRDPNPEARTRLGAHYIIRKDDRLIERYSPPSNLQGVQEMDAVGTYCFASYTDLWKWTNEKIKFNFSQLPRFALDGTQTNNLKRKGYKILVDFGMWCDHLQACGGKIISWGKKQAVPMVDVWISKYQDYAQGIIVKKPLSQKQFYKGVK